MSAQLNEIVINESNDHKISELPLPKGPGRRLKQVREDKNLDRALIASQLHLSEKMIMALERDNYDELPSKVFVQGYLRNYSRLLGLSEEAVLTAYHSLNPTAEPEFQMTGDKSSLRKEINSGHHIIQIMTVLIIAGLITLFVSWWQNYLSYPSFLSSTTATVAPEKTVPSDQPTITTSLPPLPQVKKESVKNTPTIATTSENTSIETTKETTLEQTVAIKPAVSINFNEKSWVDIKDSSGKRLLYGEIPAGKIKTLDGQAPFTITFGNASKVFVFVNETLVDTSEYTSRDVAKFTLNPSDYL